VEGKVKTPEGTVRDGAGVFSNLRSPRKKAVTIKRERESPGKNRGEKNMMKKKTEGYERFSTGAMKRAGDLTSGIEKGITIELMEKKNAKSQTGGVS